MHGRVVLIVIFFWKSEPSLLCKRSTESLESIPFFFPWKTCFLFFVEFVRRKKSTEILHFPGISMTTDLKMKARRVGIWSKQPDHVILDPLCQYWYRKNRQISQDIYLCGDTNKIFRSSRGARSNFFPKWRRSDRLAPLLSHSPFYTNIIQYHYDNNLCFISCTLYNSLNNPYKNIISSQDPIDAWPHIKPYRLRKTTVLLFGLGHGSTKSHMCVK